MGGEGEGERKRETHRRVTFQCQLYNAFYYAGALLWGNTAMKKRGRRRDERGREERAEEERNCTARVSYRVITILGHFHPLPSLSPSPASPALSPSHPPPLPSSATSSDIKLFIVHNGASSFVQSKKNKKKEYINGRNRRRERTTPSCLRGKGVLRQICRSPSSASPPDRSPPPSLLFFTANAKA